MIMIGRNLFALGYLGIRQLPPLGETRKAYRPFQRYVKCWKWLLNIVVIWRQSSEWYGSSRLVAYIADAVSDNRIA